MRFWTPFCIGLLCCVPIVNTEAQPRPFIRPTDVVFMYGPSDPSLYDSYSATIAGWGGRARSDSQEAVKHFRERVEEAHKRGVQYCGSVDFLVDFGGFIDFSGGDFLDAVCRDLDGNPLRVPWLWDHKHKGHPAYWFCTNHPKYQAYLFDQAKRACAAPIDGFHIDDYSGTSACSAYNGGCFCRWCMEGFRAYLRDRFPTDELKETGIVDLVTFDYGEFLRQHGVTAETYKTDHSRCPLISLFQRFQNEKMKERISAVYEYAERLCGKPLLRSINSSASTPRSLVPSTLIDYFCGEVDHEAPAARAPVEPVLVYKIVEALGRRQTATASGQDWAWIKANEKPGLVRLWIAQAYAFGSVFMVPHNQWCYTRELGTHWWHGKPEDFAYLYRFVRENPSLFEGTTFESAVAVLYTAPDYEKIRDACFQLAEANIPFTVLVSGNEELPARLDPKDTRAFDYLIVGDHAFRDIKNGMRQDFGATLVPWKGLDNLPKRAMDQTRVTGAENIRMSFRKKEFTGSTRLIVHLLNQAYDADSDAVRPVDVQVRIGEEIALRNFGRSFPKKATVYSPETVPVEILVEWADGQISFVVNGLHLWSVVELS